VKPAEGEGPAWEAVQVKDGRLRHPALAGGYLYWPVKVDQPCIRLLEASGQTMSYVNGEPHCGDAYSTIAVCQPIQLRAGVNDLLFHCGRGQLSARLKTPTGPALLETRDSTLPDLIPDEKEPVWAAVQVINASTEPLTGLRIRSTLKGEDKPLLTPIPPLGPLSVRKVGFRIPAGPLPQTDPVVVELKLESDKEGKSEVRDTANLTLRIRTPSKGETYKRTFLSQIDGSVQYYAVRPTKDEGKGKERPALVLTLHGASVEALGQADAYSSRPGFQIVAPTNRRPYGFDWEDWGRLDAIEVLDLAQKELNTDPSRTYLTGHSMGGHGTWQVGAHYPDRFAAIAPSAGWVSLWSYTGSGRPEPATPMQALLQRGSNPSDTLSLARNYALFGVYVLHGDADDNVPVSQARIMRKELGAFHPDFAYYERPGAGHWWGNACVDWPPLFDFLSQRQLPKVEDVRQVEFATVSPGISSRARWVSIESQVRPYLVSSVKLRLDPKKRLFSGSTDNVARLRLDLAPLKPGEPVRVELDGLKLAEQPWPKEAGAPLCLWLRRVGDGWVVDRGPSPDWKGPHRYGPFKEAFQNRMQLVYGTRGNAQENAWAYAKARYDAETFWYRGNGSVDVVADRDFDQTKEPDRNVILYGHEQSNGAWTTLLKESPVQVRRDEVQLGERKEKGSDLACFLVRPRPGSSRALVAAISGTGLPGLRLTERRPIFVSGVGYPDCLLLDSSILSKGQEGVRAAGFFGPDWGLTSGEFVYRRGE